MASDLRAQLQSSLGSVYTLERELGGGGMSRVFAAEETALGRRVVVKVVPPELAHGLSVERFRREILLAARLQHPHVVPLLAAGEAGGVLFYTMPFVEGESLRARLARTGALPVAEAVRLACEVAEALAYAHGEGVVHRDVKPENILLSRGHALVADFGIAKAISAAGTEASGASLTGTGFSVGTPAYMSPEQAAGERDVDARSDVYALGCVLYETLTGVPPFSGAGAAAVIVRHFTEPPPRPSALRPDVPAHVDDAVVQALAKSPAERFASAAALAHALSRPAEGSSAPGSLAVLPFANMSTDPENEYFSDGITEELLNVVAQLPGLRVPARTSSFAFKGRNVPIREIARQLEVAFVLEGSVRRAGSRARITAQLIDARTDRHVWSRTYDRDVSDVFAVQDELARAIADALLPALALPAGRPAAGAGTASPEAHDLYLRGRYALHNAFTEQNLRTALALFEQALAADPGYALAWVGICETWMWLADTWVAPMDAYPRAREAALRALALDPTLADAHAAFGVEQAFFDWDRAAAERSVERARQLSPDSASVLLNAAGVYLAIERPDAALAALARARRLDPVSPRLALLTAWALGAMDRFDEALHEERRILDLLPDEPLTLWWMGEALAMLGRHEEALAYCRRAEALDPHPQVRAAVARMHAALGARAEALRIARELEAEREHRYISPVDLAGVYIGLGDADAALRSLEHAYEIRSAQLSMYTVCWSLRPLREDPRFQALVRRMRGGAAVPRTQPARAGGG